MAKKTLKNAPCTPQGLSGGVKNTLDHCELGLHTEFQSPSTYPSGEKKKKKEGEMNDENNGYLLYMVPL